MGFCYRLLSDTKSIIMGTSNPTKTASTQPEILVQTEKQFETCDKEGILDMKRGLWMRAVSILGKEKPA